MKKIIFFVLAGISFFACDTAIQEPVPDNVLNLPETKSKSVQRCENIQIENVFELGGPIVLDFNGMTELLDALTDAGAFDEHSGYDGPLALIDGSEVTGYIGAFPEETTIAGVTGVMGAIITHTSAANENYAVFIRLFHFFISDDGEDVFVTLDHAVQSSINPKKNTARINTDLEVLAGTGIFANASGKLSNNGMMIFGADESVELNAYVHGNICGDGI